MADPASRPASNEHNDNTLATPAFLSSLRPPPLPLWAVQPASTALTATSYSLHATQVTTSIGFSIARASTSFGFQAARALSGPLLSVLDYSLGTGGVGPVAQGSALAFNVAESAALAGIGIGETITNLALGGASSLNVMLSEVYGGNDEALRTLGVFLQLVRREWTTSLPTDPYPDGGLSRWNLAEVSKAAATWAALQSVTTEVEGCRVIGELEELDLASWGRGMPLKEESEVVWEVTEEDLLQSGEEVIAASIGQESDGESVKDESRGGSTEQLSGNLSSVGDDVIRLNLHRFSRMALGSYGGIGTVFFGVKLPVPTPTSIGSNTTPLTIDALSTLARAKEEDSVSGAFGPKRNVASTLGADAALEAKLGHLEPNDAVVEGAATETTESVVDVGEDYGLHAPPEPSKPFDLWNLIMGKHDEAVLHSLAGVDVESSPPEPESSDEDDDITSPSELEKRRAARLAEQEARLRREAKGRRPPRFFVITDHPNRSVLLILRGTLGLDDIATDLACEPTPFDSSLYWDSDRTNLSGAENPASPTYQVHGGMMEMALAMGDQDGPVTRAIAKALKRNEGYDLYLVGHSLGAGVASLLGLMWADSGLTTSRSGLPQGRKLQVYGFATPCVTDAELSKRCRSFIHTFIYSSDAISRFSLGHMKDIRSAAAWLCFANSNPEQATTNILSRILAFQRGKLDHDPTMKAGEASWFASLRLALEANQDFSDLFPPGNILWLTRGDDLTLPTDDTSPREGHRLFKVSGRPEVVFKQMMFSRNMLSSHLPHQYMNVIEMCL